MSEQVSALIHLLTTDPVCLPEPCSPESWTFPLLLVWWSIALVLVALFAALHLLWQTWRLRRTFLRLVQAIQNIRVPGHSLTRAGFEQVDTLLRDNPLTKAGWSEFQETVLREEKGNTGEIAVFNTQPAAEFFPHTAVEQRIAAFHRLMPAVLTSAGLLGTFVALLIGLHGVHVDTERPIPAAPTGQAAIEPSLPPDLPSEGQVLPAQQPRPAVQGIDALINSLSGKFLSSIVALILSVFYAIGEAVRLRRASDAHHEFCAAFDALFVRRTTEGLLQQIHQEIESQSAAFRHFNTDLSGYLKQSFQESLGPTLNRLTEALERMTSTNEERIAQLVGSLSEAFRSSLTESAQTEFQQLAQSLEQTAELLRAMNTQSQSAQQGLETLLVRLDEFQRQQVAAAEAQRKAMEELFTEVAHQAQGVASQSSANLDQTVGRLLERTATWSNETATGVTRVLTDHARVLEERMGTLLARLDTIVAEMGRSTQSGAESLLAAVGQVVAQLEQAVTAAASTLQDATTGVLQQTGTASVQFRDNLEQMVAKLLEQLTASSKETTADVAGVFAEHTQLFEARTKTLLDRLSETAAEMGRSTQSGSEQLSAAVSGVVTRLERVVTAAASAMQGATADVAQQTGNVSAQISEQIRQLLTQQTQQVQALKVTCESLVQATGQVRALLKDTGDAFGQIRPLISDLVATTRELRSVGEIARNAHTELQQVSASFAQQGRLLQQTIDHHKAFLDQFQNVFKTVEQGLGGILRQIGEGMQRYQEALRVSLRQHLQEFDNHLATATQQIKASVEGIGPGLEDLAEAIDSAAKRIGNDGRRR